MQPLADSISTAFDSVTTANARSLIFQFYVSWLRRVTDYSFGIVGTSKVNNALVRGETTVLTPIDAFDFTNETDQVINLEYDRFIQEPLGGISFGIIWIIPIRDLHLNLTLLLELLFCPIGRPKWPLDLRCKG